MPKKRTYSIDFKKEVIGYAQLHNIITAADYYRLGRNTVANWIKQFKQQGTEGLVRKKKKEDNQQKKLDDKLVKFLWEYKQKNPKTTLKKIKKEFNLDCSLTLLSRKLSRVNSDTKVRDLSKFKPIQSFSVYINVLSKVNIKGQVHSLYQINIEDNISHNKFIGYSLEKNTMNISLFIDYVLSNLKDKGVINSNYEIQTNIPNLIRNEKEDININRFVTSKHNTSLTINKNLNTSESNIEIESDLFSHNKLIKSIYKELVLGSKNVDLVGGLSSENIIIPPIFVDSFIQDLDKIIRFTDFWKTVSIPDNQNKLLLETLTEIEEYGDKAQIDFDFDKAINIYHKILLTCNGIKNSTELRSQVNLKQGKIYYHIDNFDTSEQLLEDNIEIASNSKLFHELGESYHYLGMIYHTKSEKNKADQYFMRASNAFYKSKNKEDIFSYYKTQIRKKINNREYKKALKIVDKFISNAKGKDNTLQLVIALGLKSTVLYHLELYEKSEKILLEQNQLAKKSGHTAYEADSLIDILNLYTAGLKKNYNVIDKYYNKLKELSNKLKKPSYMYNADATIGMYYLNNRNYKLAKKYFMNVLQNIKGHLITDYFSNFYANILFYLAYTYYREMCYSKAIRYFNKSRLVCEEKSIDGLMLYVENAIGRIFYFNKSYRRALLNFNRSIKKAIIFKVDFILADSFMYLGKIYKERSMNTKALKYFNCSLSAYNRLRSKRKDLDIINDIKEIKLYIKEIIVD